MTSGAVVSKARVGRAIIRGGHARGWVMKRAGASVIMGTLHVRDHVAVVSIPYSSRSYSIKYKSSKNLTRRGYIHKNYQSWINLLNKSIQRQLASSR